MANLCQEVFWGLTIFFLCAYNEIMKKRIRKYLKKYKITAGRFADLAKVSRWSVKRYLDEKDADVLHGTYEKMSEYMLRNP